MSLKDLMAADVANVFFNTDEFADTITLVKVNGGAIELTANQRFSLLGLPPIPDGTLSAYDRLHMLGLYRIGEGAEGGESTMTIDAITEFDIEDEGQGNVIDDDNGRRIIRMGRVHVAATNEIITADKAENCDEFLIAGDRWSCLRLEGHDPSMKTVVIRNEQKITTKKGRKRP